MGRNKVSKGDAPHCKAKEWLRTDKKGEGREKKSKAKQGNVKQSIVQRQEQRSKAMQWNCIVRNGIAMELNVKERTCNGIALSGYAKEKRSVATELYGIARKNNATEWHCTDM